MRKDIILFLLLGISIFSFGQSRVSNYVPHWDSLELEGYKDLGLYFNKIDLTENRVDSFISKVNYSNNYDDENIKEEVTYTIVFHEFDNLLVIENIEKFQIDFYFLEFLYEEGSYYHCTKHYSTEKSDRISIEYNIDEAKNKTIAYLTVYSNEKNEYRRSYFR
jgi:hypothetical protein